MLDLWICALKWNTSFQFDDFSLTSRIVKPTRGKHQKSWCRCWLASSYTPLWNSVFVSVAWHSILLFFCFLFCKMRKLLKRQHHILLISVLYTSHHNGNQKKRDVTADNHTWILVGPQSYLLLSSRFFPCFHLERSSPCQRGNVGVPDNSRWPNYIKTYGEINVDLQWKLFFYCLHLSNKLLKNHFGCLLFQYCKYKVVQTKT